MTTLPFKDFWASLSADEKRELAHTAGTSVGYLRQIACGHRRPGINTLYRLMKADTRISMTMFTEAL